MNHNAPRGRRLLVALLLPCALAACGQKGDLVRPTPPSAQLAPGVSHVASTPAAGQVALRTRAARP